MQKNSNPGFVTKTFRDPDVGIVGLKSKNWRIPYPVFSIPDR